MIKIQTSWSQAKVLFDGNVPAFLANKPIDATDAVNAGKIMSGLLDEGAKMRILRDSYTKGKTGTVYRMDFELNSNRFGREIIKGFPKVDYVILEHVAGVANADPRFRGGESEVPIEFVFEFETEFGECEITWLAHPDKIIDRGDHIQVIEWKWLTEDLIKRKSDMKLKGDRHLIQVGIYASMVKHVYQKPVKACVVYLTERMGPFTVEHLHEEEIELSERTLVEVLSPAVFHTLTLPWIRENGMCRLKELVSGKPVAREVAPLWVFGLQDYGDFNGG